MLFPKSEPTVLTSSDDLNNIRTPGHYQIANANAPANCPSWGGLNSYVLVFRWWNESRFAQILIENNTNDIGIRIGSLGSPWSEWKEL